MVGPALCFSGLDTLHSVSRASGVLMTASLITLTKEAPLRLRPPPLAQVRPRPLPPLPRSRFTAARPEGLLQFTHAPFRGSFKWCGSAGPAHRPDWADRVLISQFLKAASTQGP